MSSYSEFISKPVSNKSTLSWVEPTQRLVFFDVFSGSIYSRSVDYYVVAVSSEGTALTEASSTSLSSGEWYFDPSDFTLYVRQSDDGDPDGKITVTYRFFFSDYPSYLSHNLNSGTEVYYEPLIRRVSPLSQELDDEAIGIPLEGRGTISLVNTDGYFDPIFDTLFWENASITIFSNSTELDNESEIQKVFEGVVTEKSFSEKEVRFKASDFVERLKEELPLPIFSSSDGTLDDSLIGKPKRRIYGKADGLKLVPIDVVNEGYALTGTISGTAGSTNITGSGTAFTTELQQGDQLIFGDNEYTVERVSSSALIVVSDEISSTFTAQSAIVNPARPYRNKNRNWHVSGDKLSEPSPTITNYRERTRFDVSDTSGISAGDFILLNGDYREVRRVSGDTIILNTNLSADAQDGDTVQRTPITNVYYLGKKLVPDRDWSYTNTTECTITFTNTMEFNIAPIRNLGSVTFTASSRTVTSTAFDVEANIEAGDWVRSDDLSHTTWYRVTHVVDEDTFQINTVYGGSTDTTTTTYIKKPVYLDSRSVVTADVFGKEDSNGNWLYSASDAVKDIIVSDLGITNIDTASFNTAKEQAFYTLSLTIPGSPGGRSPRINSVIQQINQSVFGSVVSLNDFSVAFRVVDPERDDSITEIKEDDVYSYSTKSTIDLVSKAIGNYRHFDASRFEGEPGSKAYEFDNNSVVENIGIVREKTVDIYLYDDDWARIITQRYALLWSLARSRVSVKTNLLFALNSLGDKLKLSFDRVYKRFGDSQRSKIGLITKIMKSGNATEIQLEDLGNMFNRVPTLAGSSANDYTDGTDSEKILIGWITDNTTLLPGSNESDIGANIIG